MKYTGRIAALGLVIITSLLERAYQYMVYDTILISDLIGPIFYGPLGWWIGRFYDKTRLQAENLKESKKELKESEEKYRRLVVLSPDPIIIHDGNFILFANEKATKLIGAKSYHELVGKSIFDFVHADYHESTSYRIRKMNRTMREAGITELKIIGLDGQMLDIEISANVITYKGKPACQVIFRDITERKLIEKALKESEERYRFIAENSTDTISLLSAEGLYLYNSPACKRLLGYSPEELDGRSFLEFIHPDDYPKLEGMHIEAMDELDIATFSFQFLAKNGQYIWLETNARTLRNEDGSLRQILAVTRNIMERKKFEENLVESNRLLQQLSNLDGLTGIANRRFFDAFLNLEWDRAACSAARLSVIMLDIDYFKRYNDTYGHQAGDDCLRTVASVLQKTLNRSSDLIARYGGEEFVVILPNTDMNGALVVAESLRKNIEKLQIPHLGSKIGSYLTISLGIASMIPQLGSDPQELINQADKALYQAKQEGRNRSNQYRTVSAFQ